MGINCGHIGAVGSLHLEFGQHAPRDSSDVRFARQNQPAPSTPPHSKCHIAHAYEFAPLLLSPVRQPINASASTSCLQVQPPASLLPTASVPIGRSAAPSRLHSAILAERRSANRCPAQASPGHQPLAPASKEQDGGGPIADPRRIAQRRHHADGTMTVVPITQYIWIT